MSDLPKGKPCYGLVWEGALGSFYEIDSGMNINVLGEVLSSPGNRYGVLYGLADPTFPKDGPFPRASDPGKLMALASFSKRSNPTPQEKALINFLLEGPFRPLSAYEDLENAPHRDVGVTDPEFCNFVGIYSDALFERFYHFAKEHFKEKRPLLIGGGCGLNCDWNSKWRESGLFSEVFVPPVANDSGSAIGTAVDAQLYFTGNPKIIWTAYCGEYFIANDFDPEPFEIRDSNYELLAELLANNLILAWVNGKYEIGPRALGNRSILAAPFLHSTRVRLNEIKQREQFRPIAPVCLEEDAARWFGCDHASPYMLYTYRAKTDALAAVTHVNGSACIQTVSSQSNQSLYNLLVAFKQRTGYGVLCNTSLNFHGRGFINKMKDLATYTLMHKLDGFVVDGRVHLARRSESYQAYLKQPDCLVRRLSEQRI